MYSKNTADVAFIKGDFGSAAKMYYEGASEGDVLEAFNY
jgi:hypothetical protein